MKTKDAFKERLARPMLAKRSEPFDSENHIYEIKWDGIRCISYIDKNSHELRSRNNISITAGYPELASFPSKIKCTSAILDGELIVLENGNPSFGAWQKRSMIKDALQLKRAAFKTPAVYIVFDILYINGSSISDRTLLERKSVLCDIIKENDRIILSKHIFQYGILFFQKAVEKNMEGVIAKDKNSFYRQGIRSGSWLKFKKKFMEDFIICGFLPSGTKKIASLVLGSVNDGSIEFRGLVSASLPDETLALLAEYLELNIVGQIPFKALPVQLKNPVWVTPKIICTVEYLEKSTGGLLRHAVLKVLKI